MWPFELNHMAIRPLPDNLRIIEAKCFFVCHCCLVCEIHHPLWTDKPLLIMNGEEIVTAGSTTDKSKKWNV